jgi:single-strand DNA-binding protein
MMNIKNHVQLIGHLGADPEVKTLENGSKVARFSIAINESYTSKSGEKVTNTHWHNVVAWGKLASIVQGILNKGSHVTVDGKLLSRQYTDKNGNKRTSVEIVANELMVLNHNKAA